MSFSYNLTVPYSDVSRIRFHIGDVDSTAAMLTDEEITFRIAESGDWKHAVIDCLSSIIARLSMEGEFQADWLHVSKAVALTNFQKLLTLKRLELGVALIQATAVYTYRPDGTNFTEAPTYSSPADDDFDDDDDD